MHPSQEIYCEKSKRLRGKTIVMGITGSIAATECFATIRELIRHGADVYPVLTEAAAKLVAPDALEFASGHAPVMELTGKTEHVSMVGNSLSADLFLIYPATANTVSKIACGIDDTTVTSMATVALGSGIPVAIAPAMHESMYRNPAVSENIEKLKSWGIQFIGPRTDGIRAKVASRDEVVAWTFRMLSRNYLSGKRILVIGGRSEEPIDSMRIITNRSTGMMAAALAERAFDRGADVDLWMGGCSAQLPDYIPTRRFATVSDLISMVDDIDHDVVLVPAALADFTPESIAKGKISSDDGFELNLNPVPKVLPLIRSKCDTVVGFKAESGLSAEDLIARARSRLEMYDLAAVVANDIDVVGMKSSSAHLVTADSSSDISGTKAEVSDAILDYCVSRL
ncbi:MAG: bifunctional phosphopantothenoylcysteine decarboxylase/phosphopantothenate--cysteine ligase CoaBC [Candidatus Methanomethylophilaceae archaeon]|nr:bifunctional phosphopantothenoylcysteine decarboxylase/phosphopantothenate--cysteine ligase CoaBC [Candidatus Methanomethylophilaceae archaeon]MBR2347695.1 bifunctional phosphopantothenoylcysteine decarboxylase/phosphopantothenate--cysteine ligase CoaBC [Candidatus Methanomethylophilaceae archaeon]MBR2394597.1 bifunctional phosphopantothenoylcysteine decarboxylase/phosphopantothenate--cysteine ligase CoaBC [Candidatus Methanomethylophilaceae archaeon]